MHIHISEYIWMVAVLLCQHMLLVLGCSEVSHDDAVITQFFRNTHNNQVLLYHGSSRFHVLPITAPPAACGGTLPAGTGVSDERRSSARDGGVRWRWQCGCGLGSWLKSVGPLR